MYQTRKLNRWYGFGVFSYTESIHKRWTNQNICMKMLGSDNTDWLHTRESDPMLSRSMVSIVLPYYQCRPCDCRLLEPLWLTVRLLLWLDQRLKRYISWLWLSTVWKPKVIEWFCLETTPGLVDLLRLFTFLHSINYDAVSDWWCAMTEFYSLVSKWVSEFIYNWCIKIKFHISSLW